MTAASALSGPELFAGVQGGANVKITATQVQTFAAAAGLTIGTTTITSGTTTRFLYDLAGVVSETAALTYTAATGQVGHSIRATVAKTRFFHLLRSLLALNVMGSPLVWTGRWSWSSSSLSLTGRFVIAAVRW
jgi:hypothetical protein